MNSTKAMVAMNLKDDNRSSFEIFAHSKYKCYFPGRLYYTVYLLTEWQLPVNHSLVLDFRTVKEELCTFERRTNRQVATVNFVTSNPYTMSVKT